MKYVLCEHHLYLLSGGFGLLQKDLQSFARTVLVSEGMATGMIVGGKNGLELELFTAGPVTKQKTSSTHKTTQAKQ